MSMVQPLTHKSFAFFLLVATFCCCRATKLSAQVAKGSIIENTSLAENEKYAVIVGISTYKQLPSLSFAHIDAAYFAQYLEKVQGVKSQNIKLFLNDTATLSILFELNKIKQKIKPGDRVYFYFSGHGDIETEMNQGGLLLLHESNAKNYYLNPNGYIQQSQLKAVTSSMVERGAEVVFIADACHAGELSGGENGKSSNLLALQEKWSKETKIFSCQAHEISLEGTQWGKGRGLFSWHLINGLMGAADSIADGELDGTISLYELQHYLQAKVRKEAKPNTQNPVVVGNSENTMAYVSSTKKMPPQTDLLLADFSAETKSAGRFRLSAETETLFNKFQTAVKDRKLTGTNSALQYLEQLKTSNAGELVIEDATRTVVSALLRQSAELINPLITGNEMYGNKTTIEGAVKDMETAMGLLGADHYLYSTFEARKYFLKAVGLTITAADADKKENQNQAIKWLEQSATLEPHAYYAYFQLGVLWFKKKFPDKAIEYFNKYKSFLPKDADTYNNIGLAYYKLGNLNEAIQYVATAISMDTSNYVYYFNMGNIHSASGSLPKGVRAYRKALSLQPNNTSVLFNIANAFNYAGLYDSSIAYYQQVLKLNRTDGKAWQYLGNTQKSIRRYDDAVKSYQEALKNGNSAFRIYYNLSCIYSLKNDKDQSLDFLEKALQAGMNDFVLEIFKDPEMANARSANRFSHLMKKYAAK